MALFRYKNSKNFWYEFEFAGQRIRETTRTRSKKLARDAERTRRRELEEAYNGVQKRQLPKLFSVASQEWLELKKLTLAESSVRIERDNLKHLNPVFGKMLLTDIHATHIAAYQQKRLGQKASAKTVNLELGTLRAIMRRFKVWANVQQDVRMLPTRDDIGHALTEEEETPLLAQCMKSRSRSLHPAVVLALSTGMRYSEIRLLRWKQVDFVSPTITVGKSKTEHGTGRVIPLNTRAAATLKMWASQFPNRQSSHYVFPSERYGAAGDDFTACAYDLDPTKPIKSWKVAWQAAKLRAARVLAGLPESPEEDDEETAEVASKITPLKCRFHDLRHTACTRMLEGGVPYPVVASLMGWSAATAIRMAKRYGHIGQTAQRDAVALLNGGKKEAQSLENPPERGHQESKRVQ